MTDQTLLSALHTGVEHQRVSPQLAAYIAAEVLKVDARDTGYDDTVRLDDDCAWQSRASQRSARVPAR